MAFPMIRLTGKTWQMQKAVTTTEIDPLTATRGGDACDHCGALCRGTATVGGGKVFCCQGCQTVYELLTENGLGDFYNLAESAGVKVSGTTTLGHYAFLDAPSVRSRLVDF